MANNVADVIERLKGTIADCEETNLDQDALEVIEQLCAALKKLGRHPEGDMEGVGRCAGFLRAAPFRDELCDCGLNAALGPSDQKGVLTITRDVTTMSPNFRVTATTVSDVARGPCVLCGRTANP